MQSMFHWSTSSPTPLSHKLLLPHLLSWVGTLMSEKKKPQSEDQCNYQPCVHESKDQGRNQSEGRQATRCESTMRCLSFSV